jgi:predicted branched-subunit amino acid permease
MAMAAMTDVTDVTTASYDDTLRRSDFVDGVRAMSSLSLAYLPFALLVGAAAAASANPPAAWLATWAIYGGAAHLAVLAGLAQGSGWAMAALVGLLVNVRLAAYATAMAPGWRTAPMRLRLAAAVMLTDAPWALANPRSAGHRGFYLGAAATLFVAWPVMVTGGMYAGDRLIDIPVTALLPAMSLGAVVVSQLRQRPVAWAVAAASSAAVVTARLDLGAAVLICASAGVAGGVLSRRRS